MKTTFPHATAVATALLATALLIGTSAHAERQHGGFIGIGYGEFPDIEQDLGGGVTLTASEADSRLLAGYRWNRYIGLQLDVIFTDIDTCVGTTCSSVNPIFGEIGVRPSFPIGKWAEAYGRVGWVTTMDDDGTDISSDEGTWALGLEVRPWRGLWVRGEYYGVEFKSSSFEDGAWGINVGWNFFEY